MTLWIRCDQCGAELEAHRPERHAWQALWSDERGCMAHRCAKCLGREEPKRRKR